MAIALVMLSMELAVFSRVAYALCPVCTVAIAGGLGVLEYFGIDDVIGGIWIGALTVSLIVWTGTWLAAKGWHSWWVKALNFCGYFALTLSIYLLPDYTFGENTLWGIDKLFLGIVMGATTVYTSSLVYLYIKKSNGGKPWFPWQKVVMPVADVIILSIIFYYVVEAYNV